MVLRDIPVVVLRGDPETRGRQHGALYAGRIRQQIARRRADPDRYARAQPRAVAAWPRLEAEAPTVARELHGLAAGAESDPIDLLLHSGFEFFDAAPATGCSAVAVAAPDGAVVAQNWDAPPEDADDLTLFLHVGPHGVELAMIASAGMLGWVGCNHHGLALVNNDLMLDTAGHGLPSQVARRLLLTAPDIAGARTIAPRLAPMGGRAYLLGDARGQVLGLEASPSVGVRETAPADRLAHTNHALRPDITAVEDATRLQAVYPSSRHRLAVLAARLSGLATVTDVIQLLRDRTGAPDSVSKTLSAGEPTLTAFSVVFDCGARALHLCAGPPDAGLYRTIRLTDPIAPAQVAEGGGDRAGPAQTAPAPQTSQGGLQP